MGEKIKCINSVNRGKKKLPSFSLKTADTNFITGWRLISRSRVLVLLNIILLPLLSVFVLFFVAPVRT